MGFTKINISIPEELEIKLSQIVKSGEKSSFIGDCIRLRLEEMAKYELEKQLIEGYSQEAFEDSQLWENTVGDGLND